MPCDSSISLDDASSPLSPRGAKVYRSMVGLCLYIGRDRPDVMYVIKELSSKMSCPTALALQRLKKLAGYFKMVGDLSMKLELPVPGHGKHGQSSERMWILESYSDADWSSNKSHRRSTSSSVHMLNGSFPYSSPRTQKLVSLSSCESEFHALVSCICDALFIRSCLEFLLLMSD